MKKAVLTILLAIALTFSFSFIGAGSVAYAAEATTLPNGTYRADAAIDVYATVGRLVDVKLFQIPASYYFTITDNTDAEVYYVSYNGSTEADGYYVKKSDASKIAVLDKTFDVGTLGGFTVELSLTADSTFTQKGTLKFVDTALATADVTSIAFIGFGEYNSVKCAYVNLNNEKLGYIPVSVLKIKDTSTMLADYDIELHPNSRPKVDTDTTDKPATPIDNNKLTRILLIIGIVVPALVILFLLFKPSKHNRYDYDRNRQNDYGNSPYDRPRSRYRDDYYDDGRRPAPPRRDDRDDYDDGYYDSRRY